MTILIEYVIATLWLLAGAFGPILLNVFVLKIDMSEVQISWPLLAFMFCFMIVSGPLALNYYRKFKARRADAAEGRVRAATGLARLKIWPLIKWQAVGMFVGLFLLTLLQSAQIFNDYVAFGLVSFVPGVFTVLGVRSGKRLVEKDYAI